VGGVARDPTPDRIPVGVAVLSAQSGDRALGAGDLAGARRRLEEGLAIDRELGDRPGLAGDLEVIAGLLLELGDLPGARKVGEQALALGREVGDPTEAAVALMRLAMVLQAEGDLRGAEAGTGTPCPSAGEGTRDLVADTQFNLGELRKAQGDLAAAGGTTRRRRRYGRTSRRPSRSPRAGGAGQPRDRGGTFRSGRGASGAALEVFSAQRATDWEASAQAVLAHSLLGGRRHGDARKALERAFALSGRSQSPFVRLTVAAIAGRVEAAVGEADGALLRLDAALAEAARLRLAAFSSSFAWPEARSGPTPGGPRHPRSAGPRRGGASPGFGLVARKAEAILRPRPGKPQGAS